MYALKNYILLFYITFFCFFHRVQASSPSVIHDDNATITLRTEAIKIPAHDPVLFFNKALQFIKTNQLGLALAYLRETQLLAPRHQKTQDALNYLQYQLKAKGFQKSDSFLSVFEDSLGKYFLLPEALTLHWSFSLVCLVILSKLFRDRRRARLKANPIPPWKLKHWSICSLWIFMSTILLFKTLTSLDQQATIIKPDVAFLRSGPLPDAAELNEIPEGALVTIKDYHGDWVQIRYNQGPLGWIAKNDLLILTPEGLR